MAEVLIGTSKPPHKAVTLARVTTVLAATVIAAAKALFQQVEEPLTQATLDANRSSHYAQSAIAHRPAFGLGSRQRRFPSGTQKGTGSGWYRPSADAEPKPRLPPQL